MAVDEKRPLSLSDVSATMLITLYARALETQTSNPILVDEKAVELRQALNPLLTQAEGKLYQELVDGDLPTWSYFDEDEPKLGLMRLFRHWDLFRKMQWTVHYRLYSPS